MRPGFAGSRLLGWNAFVDDIEYVPELKWPGSVRAYQKMGVDAQLEALMWGLTGQIRKFKFQIDPNGAADEMVAKISQDYNLPIVGEEGGNQSRSKNRFKFDEHIEAVFLALECGHMCFEQVGYIGDDGLWHVRKLEPRMPDTIAEINVAEDGGLVSIKQFFTKQGSMFPLEIPVDRIVWYPWAKRGPNWVGRSMFRSLYRNWLVKDRLIRVDAINHERAGGVPWAEAPPGASPNDIKQLSQMAQDFKVGEDSGGAVPAGAKMNIARVGGSTDVIESIRYHDEAMARRFMLMVMMLGMTATGSRGLGQTFSDLAMMAQKSIANWLVDVFNEHVIEDDIDWNWGEQVDLVPKLTYIIEDEDEYIAVTDLGILIDKGVLTVDDQLEEAMRGRFRLPEDFVHGLQRQVKQDTANLDQAGVPAAGATTP